MSDDIYEAYAIQYGYSDRRSSENFIGGDPHDVPMPLNYYIWVIRNEKRTFVLDTGFSDRSGAARKRELVHPIADGLRKLGIAPDTVEDVIISHLHYDHAGNFDLFPKARFHVQDCEMAFATGRCMCQALMRHPFEAEDVANLVFKVYEERVRFHEGESEIAPGITAHLIGGHSKGLQAIRVKTRRGYVMLAADAAHFYAHMDQRRVFPTVYNVADVLAGYETCERLATSKDHIVPGHDPLVMDIYPPVGPNMDGWAVRLDADPKPRR